MLNSLNRYKVDMKVKVLTRMIDNLRYSIQFSGQNTSRDDDRMTQSPLPHRLDHFITQLILREITIRYLNTMSICFIIFGLNFYIDSIRRVNVSSIDNHRVF